MKYLIFNMTVAAALVYLVAGDGLGLKSTEDKIVEMTDPHVEKVTETAQELTVDDIRPMVEDLIASHQDEANNLSADDIKNMISEAIADAMATTNLETVSTKTEAILHDTEQLPVTIVETPVTHAPPVETGGLGEPVASDPVSEPVFENAQSTAPIQLAEGESMMTPQTRQKELDKLVGSLELMFLDLAQ